MKSTHSPTEIDNARYHFCKSFYFSYIARQWKGILRCTRPLLRTLLFVNGNKGKPQTARSCRKFSPGCLVPHATRYGHELRPRVTAAITSMQCVFTMNHVAVPFRGHCECLTFQMPLQLLRGGTAFTAAFCMYHHVSPVAAASSYYTDRY